MKYTREDLVRILDRNSKLYDGCEVIGCIERYNVVGLREVSDEQVFRYCVERGFIDGKSN